LGLLGLIAVSQSLAIVKNLGMWSSSAPLRRLDDLVNLAIGGLYLISALLLEISRRDRISTEVSLRLAEASPGNAARLSTKAPNAVLVLARNGRIIHCSPAAEEILCRKRGDVIGTKPTFERTEPVSIAETSRAGSPHQTILEA
jgi:PAS domain-containing protein